MSCGENGLRLRLSTFTDSFFTSVYRASCRFYRFPFTVSMSVCETASTENYGNDRDSGTYCNSCYNGDDQFFVHLSLSFLFKN